jgi:hypothetical protein
MEHLDYLLKDDTYSILGILLYATSGNPRYSLLNELVYLMDNRSFVNFLKYYEGQTIQVPTLEETQEALRFLLYFQYAEIEGLGHYAAMDKAGIPRCKGKLVMTRLKQFKEELESKNYQIGGIQNVVKNAKVQ